MITTFVLLNTSETSSTPPSRVRRTPRRCGSSSGGVKPTPGSQLALFATYSYHGFIITDRDGETLELEADHRRHAEIENAIRDLKYGVGLNHMPSGRFAANGAWLAVQVMAHTLARWTARIGLGEQIVTTKALRRRVFALAGRLTRSARRLTLHLPQRWPWETQFSRRPDPAASHSTPNLTAPVRQCPQRPLQLAPVRSASASCRVLSRHLAHHTHCRPPSASPKAPADRRQSPSTRIRARTIRVCYFLSPFQCPLPVHPCPSVDSGLGRNPLMARYAEASSHRRGLRCRSFAALPPGAREKSEYLLDHFNRTFIHRLRACLRSLQYVKLRLLPEGVIMSHSYSSDISREQFARILPCLESARAGLSPAPWTCTTFSAGCSIS